MFNAFRRATTALLLLIGFALSPSNASAAVANGYVCTVSFDPRAGTYGSFGVIDFTLHTLPDCAGTSLGNFRVMTTGAGTEWDGIRYSSTQILTMFDQLHRASIEATKVLFGYTGGSEVGAYQMTFKRQLP